MNDKYIETEEQDKALIDANKELGTSYSNWQDLSYQASKAGLLTMDFIKRNIQNLYFRGLLMGMQFNEDELVFLTDYIIKYHIGSMLDDVNPDISKDIKYDRNIEQYFLLLYRKHHVSEAFIEKYISFIKDINFILCTQEVSEAFIERHKNKIDDMETAPFSYRTIMNWRCVCRYQNISNEYIEKLLEDPAITSLISFEGLLNNPHVTADRMEYIIELASKYNRTIDWSHVGENPNITNDFIKRHIKEPLDWWTIFIYHKLPINLIEEIIDIHKDDSDYDRWFGTIVSHQDLTEAFMKKWWHRIDWKYAVQYQKLSEDLIRMLFYHLDLNDVLEYQDLTDDMRTYIKEFIKENYI